MQSLGNLLPVWILELSSGDWPALDAGGEFDSEFPVNSVPVIRFPTKQPMFPVNRP